MGHAFSLLRRGWPPNSTRRRDLESDPDIGNVRELGGMTRAPSAEPGCRWHAVQQTTRRRAVGWGTYIDGRVEHLENDLRHVPVAQRSTVDYITTWAATRDTRILAELPTISADLSPIWPTDAIQPVPATKPDGWNWWSGDRTERAYSALHRAD